MKRMSFEDFAAQRDDSMRLIDVRELDEYQAIRVTGAEFFPLSRLQRGERFEDDGRAVFLICRSGARSEFAAQMIEKEGFPECTNISDGTMGALKSGEEYLERG